MPEFTLRLMDETQAAGEPIPFDRRRSLRRRLTQRATALIGGGAGGGTPRLMPVETLDISDAGIGVIAESPLQRGVEVRLFFPPHGSDPGFELRGWVARCMPREGRYHIGLTFGRQSATAA